MSQSNSYRYFRDRQALVTMLAESWFQGVEDGVAAAVASRQTPEEKIVQWVLTTMQIKCTKFDADPVLFSAYLNLAKGEAEAVACHVGNLRSIIRPAIAEIAVDEQADDALRLLEDATILFRNPYLIAQNRSTLSETRARIVTEAILERIRVNGRV